MNTTDWIYCAVQGKFSDWQDIPKLNNGREITTKKNKSTPTALYVSTA